MTHPYIRTSTHEPYLDNYLVDMELVPILINMSMRGIALRQDALKDWDKKLSEQILFYEDVCGREGFEPSKNQQVGYVLALRHNILPLTKSQKQLQVDEEVLSGLDDPLAALVLQYRSAAKLRSTYIRPCLGRKRFYTNFRMDLATSRLASFDRNIQNIPPEVREIFAPDKGTWTWIDWSQIEMRIFAYLSGDPVMLDAYATGEDIHTITQLALWPDSDPGDDRYRKPAKSFNFQMIYDATVKTLAKKSGLPIPVCAKFRDVWLRRYPVAHSWMQERAASREPYAETIFERRLRLPDPIETSEAHVNKCKINYPVQGSAAGVVARGMLECAKLGYTMAAQVHDELVIDGNVDPPESLAHIYPGLDLPFTVNKSPVWV